jgi:hypothetical protein
MRRDVAIDDRLDVVGSFCHAAECRQQVEARPHVIRHGDVLHDLVQLELIGQRQGFSWHRRGRLSARRRCCRC